MNERKLIGIFATGIFSRVQSNLYMALYEHAKKLNYNLVLFSGSYDKIRINHTATVAASLFELANNMNFAALIIHAQSIGNIELINNIIQMGKNKNIPVFVYDCEAMGIEGSKGVITINQDNKQGFADSVRHLIEHHNCKNIFMLAGMKDNKYSDDRISMYRREMETHGIAYKEEQIGYGDFWERPAAEAVNEFLDMDLPTPEAICCANDSMAITAAKVLKERGYRVPEDVLVTGFDGIEDGKYNLPTISTCEPDLDIAVEFIFDSISGKNDAVNFRVPLKFYPKESCGCNYNDNLENRNEIVRLIEGIRHDSWQHHMHSRMQIGLLDSSDLEDSVGYMNGGLSMFNGYSHLLCVRDDIEYTNEYEKPLGKMRIHMNNGFLPAEFSGSYDIHDIIPYYERVFENSEPEDLYIFRLIHSIDKIYGVNIVKAKKYITNEIRLLDEFIESVTNTLESILRNLRLKQATQKLSEMYDRMSEIYVRDTMTGIYNRQGYNQLLQEYLAREDLKNSYIHLFSIDMDGMKYINDNFGHIEGDNAIKAVANAMGDCFAQPCIYARFGGDEFVAVLFTDSETEPTSEKISAKLNNYLRNMPMLLDKKYTVGISVGQAVVKLADNIDFEEIVKIADDNMYKNKRSRKNN